MEAADLSEILTAKLHGIINLKDCTFIAVKPPNLMSLFVVVAAVIVLHT
jgi:hypothetical protein